jgi:hypothetical protein
LLQHSYDVVGDLLAEVPDCRFVCVLTFGRPGNSGSHGSLLPTQLGGRELQLWFVGLKA